VGGSEEYLETPTGGWGDPDQVDWYLDRVSNLAPRLEAENVLRSLLPQQPRSLLDLGCGDGRLAALVLENRPTLSHVVGIDASPPMLALAQERFAEDDRVTVHEWNLADSIESFGGFDVMVSGFAIHHLEHDRKRSLFAEVAHQLHPDGFFANLEVVASATPELHAEFLSAIGRTADDPEDRLADVESQIHWMEEAGLSQVDCPWRWRGFALLVGTGNKASPIARV